MDKSWILSNENNTYACSKPLFNNALQPHSDYNNRWLQGIEWHQPVVCNIL